MDKIQIIRKIILVGCLVESGDSNEYEATGQIKELIEQYNKAKNGQD